MANADTAMTGWMVELRGACITPTEKFGNVLDGWQSNASPRNHSSRMILGTQ
jgi:hypothetical protein